MEVAPRTSGFAKQEGPADSPDFVQAFTATPPVTRDHDATSGLAPCESPVFDAVPRRGTA